MSITEELQAMLATREAVGIKKYGVTVELRSDLETSDWCQHAIEEALDFAVYLMKIKRDLEVKEESK